MDRRFKLSEVAFNTKSFIRNAIISLAICSAPLSMGKDHLLTIGGGSSPTNNQVSLEKNVLYLQRFLNAAHLQSVPHEILFSNGKAGTNDLEFDDVRGNVPRVNELMAGIMNMGNGLTTTYRPHDIPDLWGASGRKSIGNWFTTVGTKLKSGDRLIIYFTGHGGRGTGKPPVNQTLAMWGEDGMTVKEFTTLLDTLPEKVDVVMVMVQCFSGGFADVLYENGDNTKPLSKRNRCGFFATIPTRVAAGCTSDADEENYKEYSTYFWAAMYGQTRLGQPVVKPDYNKDGIVSMAEAHAYTLINSETVDISMKTSDAFLQKFARGTPKNGESLVLLEGDFKVILENASTYDKAALTELAGSLSLPNTKTVQSARSKESELLRKKGDAEKAKKKIYDSREQVRRSLRQAIGNRFPELNNLLNPAAYKLIHDDPGKIVKFIESQPKYLEFETFNEEIDKAETEISNLDHAWARCQRFIKVADSVVMSANLAKIASPEIVERYKKLVQMEDSPFAKP